MSTNAVPMSQWPSDHRYVIPVAPGPDVAMVTIDGRTVQAERGELLIKVAQRSGTYIPRFCWHERMKPVGMCRMCLVEVQGLRGLQISCATPVTDGMVVDTQSPTVKATQDGVLEFLLINHPLDCPVCDRGGECPLQDQTLAFGPGESRFVEEKRHFEKPITIGDFVLLDRERCIQCGRCTRFAAEVAGEPLIAFGARGGSTEVITYPTEPFDSYFSGNTVQICPVGALTSRPYRFRARPWDLESVETSCQACAVNCRTELDSTSNRLVRLLGVDADPVNHGWLCDRGRYGLGWVHSEARVEAPLVRSGSDLVATSWPDALDRAAALLRDAVASSGPGSVAVLGGARGTNEDAYAWARLAKGVLGTDHVDAQLGDGLPADVVLGMPRATIDDLDTASAIVLLCGDLQEELPVLHLRVRRAAVDLLVPLVEVGVAPTGLTGAADLVLHHMPGEALSQVDKLAKVLANLPSHSPVDDLLPLVQGREGPVVVIVGRPSLAEHADGVVAAAARLASLPNVKFLSALHRGNVHGALDLGLAPGFLPGRVSLTAGRSHVGGVWGSVPARPGLDAAGILRAAAAGRIDVLVLVGCDPLADFPDRTLVRAALDSVGAVVSVGAFLGDAHDEAAVFLPVAVWGEQHGSTTNLEGRVTRLGRAVSPGGSVMEGWRVAGELARRLGTDFGYHTAEGIQDEISRVAPAFAGVDAALLRQARDGVVLPLADHAELVTFGPGGLLGRPSWEPIPAVPADLPPLALDDPPADDGVGLDDLADLASRSAAVPAPPVALHRWDAQVPTAPIVPVDGYALRLLAGRVLYGHDRVVVHSSALSGLEPTPELLVNPRDRDRVGVVDGGLVGVASGRGRVELTVRGDAAVPEGLAYMAVNQVAPGPADLIDCSQPVTDLRLESLS